jgi:hypothetical protein
MTLTNPVQISPSLLPGIKIGGAWVSIGYSKREGSEGRTRYRWEIVLANGEEYSGEDLQSGCGGGSLRDGMVSLLSFLGAFAESCNPRYGDELGEHADLFPVELREWAYQNEDELAMAQCEVEENKDCIVE